MTNRSVLSLLVGSLVLVIGCAPATTDATMDTSAQTEATMQTSVHTDDASVRAGIEANAAAWSAAANRGDMAAVAALYTEDAILLPPNAASVRGRQSIQRFFEGFRAVSPSNVRLFPDEITACGNTAYELGRYEMTLNPPGAAPINDRGKYIVVWQRQSDGSWRISRDIFNSDLAAAGAAQAH